MQSTAHRAPPSCSHAEELTQHAARSTASSGARAKLRYSGARHSSLIPWRPFPCDPTLTPDQTAGWQGPMQQGHRLQGPRQALRLHVGVGAGPHDGQAGASNAAVQCSRPLAGAGVLPASRHTSRSPEPPAEGIPDWQALTTRPHIPDELLRSPDRHVRVEGEDVRVAGDDQHLEVRLDVSCSDLSSPLTWGMSACCGWTMGAVDTWLIRSIVG